MKNNYRRFNKDLSLDAVRDSNDGYLTNKSIAVRRIATVPDQDGKIYIIDKTRYYPKTQKNMRTAASVYGYLRRGR